jgi:CubicO group peptidase (beta-lactamase class C family)
VSDAQRQVQQAIDRLVETGVEIGVQVAVQVAVCLRGELVVDAVAGVADPATGRAVTSDTPFFSTSTGKSMTSTVVHVLAERDVLDYDTPVVELWPEFGAHGKQSATIRHALTHTVGVPGLPPDTTPEDLCNWQKMCAAIADAEPWWEPGTRVGYHAFTYGYLIGEIVRRATGKPISQVLREVVSGPLSVADELFFSVPQPALGRLARMQSDARPMDPE